jgi:hypothetical protein
MDAGSLRWDSTVKDCSQRQLCFIASAMHGASVLIHFEGFGSYSFAANPAHLGGSCQIHRGKASLLHLTTFAEGELF